MSTDGPKQNLLQVDCVTEQTRVASPVLVPAFRPQTKPFQLQQVEGPGAPREFQLDLDEVVVGRSTQAHIMIDSVLLSRQHMALRRQGPEYICADLGSANGMFLNGVRAHSAVLRDGDYLQVGDVVFVYREGE